MTKHHRTTTKIHSSQRRAQIRILPIRTQMADKPRNSHNRTSAAIVLHNRLLHSKINKIWCSNKMKLSFQLQTPPWRRQNNRKIENVLSWKQALFKMHRWTRLKHRLRMTNHWGDALINLLINLRARALHIMMTSTQPKSTKVKWHERLKIVLIKLKKRLRGQNQRIDTLPRKETKSHFRPQVRKITVRKI